MSLLGRLFGPNVAKLEEKRDVDGLIAVASSDAGGNLQVAAIEALARLDAVAAAPALVAELVGTDAEVAGAADAAVRRLGPAAAGALADVLDGEGGERALAALVDLGGDAVEPLRGAGQSPDETTRHRALTGLLDLDRRLDEPEVGEAVFRSLLASLGDRSPTCRVIAASGLENLGDPRAGRALAAQLKDGDETVRAACRKALSVIGQDAVPNIVDVLYDRNANSRRLAAELLGEICGGDADTETCREALAALLEHVGESNAEIGDTVRRSLDAIPAAAVVSEQLELLADPERSDREQILDFLKQLLEHAALESTQRAMAVKRIETLRRSWEE